jgi:hypothetical protein
MKILIMAFSLLLFPNVSTGYSGNELLEICEGNTDDPLSTGLCTGYINGVVNGFTLMANYSAYNALEALDIPEGEHDEQFTKYFILFLRFCPPQNGLEKEQLEDVVLQYINDNFEERHLPSELLIHMALMEKFPCQ